MNVLGFTRSDSLGRLGGISYLVKAKWVGSALALIIRVVEAVLAILYKASTRVHRGCHTAGLRALAEKQMMDPARLLRTLNVDMKEPAWLAASNTSEMKLGFRDGRARANEVRRSNVMVAVEKFLEQG